MQELFSGEGSTGKDFLAHIRQYNSSFAMTSFGHKDASVSGYNPSFKIQGQVFHRIGSLFPPNEGHPKFLQVYFMDNLQTELEHRGRGQNLNHDILQTLTLWFHENNKYIKDLKTAREQIQVGNLQEHKIVIREDKKPREEHARLYNAPSTSSDIAILMSNEETSTRDIVLHTKNSSLRKISELHRSYDPLQYPILFPFGTDGYHIYLKGTTGRKITMSQYYSYHLMVRDGNYLLTAKRLFQQFLVDMYAKIETERLQFLRREQQSLRVDNYNSLRDSLLASDGNPNPTLEALDIYTSDKWMPWHM